MNPPPLPNDRALAMPRPQTGLARLAETGLANFHARVTDVAPALSGMKPLTLAGLCFATFLLVFGGGLTVLLAPV